MLPVERDDKPALLLPLLQSPYEVITQQRLFSEELLSDCPSILLSIGSIIPFLPVDTNHDEPSEQSPGPLLQTPSTPSLPCSWLSFLLCIYRFSQVLNYSSDLRHLLGEMDLTRIHSICGRLAISHSSFCWYLNSVFLTDGICK